MKRPGNAHERDQRGDERVGEAFRGERQEVHRQTKQHFVLLETAKNRGIQAQQAVQNAEKPLEKPRRQDRVIPAGHQQGQIVDETLLRLLRQSTVQADSRGYITDTCEGNWNRGMGPVVKNRDSNPSNSILKLPSS